MSHVDTIRQALPEVRCPSPAELRAAKASLDALVVALVTLADNAEAYLQLEEDGQRNYPDSLRLCIAEARAAVNDA